MRNATYRETGKSGENVTWYEVNERNEKGERMVFSIMHCTNPGGTNSLPYLWNKAGYTNGILETYIGLDTYVYDTEGACSGMYNPTVKCNGMSIDFEWMFEDTEENRQKLINEMLRRFMSAKGKTATEIKMEKIHEFAKDKELEVLDKMPEGWKVTQRWDCPYGCVVITDCKPHFKKVDGKNVKNPEHKEAILI
jgi:hypothetical protein